MNIYRYTNLGTNIQWIICEEGCGQNNCFDNLVVSSDWLFASLSKSLLVKLKILPRAKRHQTSLPKHLVTLKISANSETAVQNVLFGHFPPLD